MNAAILGQPALGDIQTRHDLHARNHRRVHLEGRAKLLEESSIDSIANPQLMIARLDVNIAGALFHRIVNAVVHQLDHRRIAGGLLEIVDVQRLRLDEAELLEIHLVDDVVDDENAFGGQIRLKRGANVVDRRGDDLALIATDPLDLFQQ